MQQIPAKNVKFYKFSEKFKLRLQSIPVPSGISQTEDLLSIHFMA